MPTPIILEDNWSPLGALGKGAGSMASSWADAYATQIIQEQYQKRSDKKVDDTYANMTPEQKLSWEVGFDSSGKKVIKAKALTEPTEGITTAGGYIYKTRKDSKGNVTIDTKPLNLEETDGYGETITAQDGDQFGFSYGTTYKIDKRTNLPKVIDKTEPTDLYNAAGDSIKAVKGSKEYKEYISQGFSEIKPGSDNIYTLTRKAIADGKGIAVSDVTDAEVLDKIQSDKADQSNQGGWDNLAPSEKEYWMDSYNLNGKRSELPFSTRDTSSWTKFSKDLAAYNIENGIAPENVLANKMTTEAINSSYKFQEKQLDTARSFQINIEKQAKEIKKLYDDTVKRFDSRIMNQIYRKPLMSLAGSGEEGAVQSYLYEISNEISKLSQSSQASVQQLPVEVQKKWDKIHDPNFSWADMEDILNATTTQAKIRMESLEEALNMTKQKMLKMGKSNSSTQITDKPKSKYSIISVE